MRGAPVPAGEERAREERLTNVTFRIAAAWYEAAMAQRIIAVVSEPISGEALRSALGSEVGDTEVLVVAPCHHQPVPLARGRSRRGDQRAEAVQEESVERLEEEGVDAVGDTGESDPLLAVQDALQTFPPDQIVLFTHSEGKRNWMEEGVVERARERRRAGQPHGDRVTTVDPTRMIRPPIKP